MKFELTQRFLRDASSLPKPMQRRIFKKLEWFAAQKNPLAFAKPLKNSLLEF